MCHVSCVTFHVSCVTCHVSPVTCQNIFFYIKKMDKVSGAGRWRVCYQRVLPPLVFKYMRQQQQQQQQQQQESLL